MEQKPNKRDDWEFKNYCSKFFHSVYHYHYHIYIYIYIQRDREKVRPIWTDLFDLYILYYYKHN